MGEIKPKRKMDLGRMGSLRIPEKDGLPLPSCQFPSDVVLLMNRWYDPFLSYPHKSVNDLFQLLESHLKGEREKMQFKRDYTDFQRIKTTKTFLNSIDDIFELAVPLNPRVIVFYKLLFGNYHSNNGSSLTNVYSDINKNSVYSKMPELIELSRSLEHNPGIILTGPDENARGNTHIISAEIMVINKVKAEYPDVKTVGTRSIADVASYINKIIGP